MDQLPSESFVRAAGFLQSKPRKIRIPALLAALGAETVLSLERTPRSLTRAAAALLLPPVMAEDQPGWLGTFPRVSLQDSACQPVPKRLAKAFPGSRTQRQLKRGLGKFQFITDLFGGSVRLGPCPASPARIRPPRRLSSPSPGAGARSPSQLPILG